MDGDLVEYPSPAAEARSVRQCRGIRPFDPAELDAARSARPPDREREEEERAQPSAELWALHCRYAAERDPRDLEALVVEYEGLAASLATRLYRGGEPLEELRQVAMEALVRVLQSFDPSRGIPFAGYATPSILGRLKRHYRDQGWTIRIGREQQNLHQAASEARADLQASLGREPSEAEIAGRVDHSVDEVRAAAAAARARSTMSIDAPVGSGAQLNDTLGGEDPAINLAEHRVDLRRAVEHLDERECDLLRLYYWERLSQASIAERYDTNQMQVSRWLSRIVARLRTEMAAAA